MPKGRVRYHYTKYSNALKWLAWYRLHGYHIKHKQLTNILLAQFVLDPFLISRMLDLTIDFALQRGVKGIESIFLSLAAASESLEPRAFERAMNVLDILPNQSGATSRDFYIFFLDFFEARPRRTHLSGMDSALARIPMAFGSRGIRASYGLDSLPYETGIGNHYRTGVHFGKSASIVSAYPESTWSTLFSAPQSAVNYFSSLASKVARAGSNELASDATLTFEWTQYAGLYGNICEAIADGAAIKKGNPWIGVGGTILCGIDWQELWDNFPSIHISPLYPDGGEPTSGGVQPSPQPLARPQGPNTEVLPGGVLDPVDPLPSGNLGDFPTPTVSDDDPNSVGTTEPNGGTAVAYVIDVETDIISDGPGSAVLGAMGFSLKQERVPKELLGTNSTPAMVDIDPIGSNGIKIAVPWVDYALVADDPNLVDLSEEPRPAGVRNTNFGPRGGPFRR